MCAPRRWRRRSLIAISKEGRLCKLIVINCNVSAYGGDAKASPNNVVTESHECENLLKQNVNYHTVEINRILTT